MHTLYLFTFSLPSSSGKEEQFVLSYLVCVYSLYYRIVFNRIVSDEICLQRV